MSTPVKHPVFLTPGELAGRWRCTLHTALRIIWRGDLPGAFKRGKEWLIPLDDIEGYEQRNSAANGEYGGDAAAGGGR